LNSTYSFSDISFVINHPSVGQYSFQGEGIGTATVAYATDVSAQDVASDGSVMTSKIKANNGTIALSVQQTSSLHSWLLKWYNYIRIAPTNQWTAATMVIRDSGGGLTTNCTGVCPQKAGDTPYQAQGQQITWTLMAANIEQV